MAVASSMFVCAANSFNCCLVIVAASLPAAAIDFRSISVRSAAVLACIIFITSTLAPKAWLSASADSAAESKESNLSKTPANLPASTPSCDEYATASANSLLVYCIN